MYEVVPSATDQPKLSEELIVFVRHVEVDLQWLSDREACDLVWE